MRRREFVRRGGAAAAACAAGLTILSDARSVRAAPANEKISLAVAGIRSRGLALATGLAQRRDCRVAYLCDANSNLLASRAESVARVQGGPPPSCLQDFRKALDDRSLDALVIAMPDHWHCLAAIWACQAGKDVYLAAPLSHNPWEGRRLVEVARRERRIVEVDLPAQRGLLRRARKFIADGKLGRIHLCRVFEQKGQSNFPAQPDSQPPRGLDWDAWNGPAPQSPYNINYQDNWHGFWRYSGGEMAVEGVQQLDLARWLCGLDCPARSAPPADGSIPPAPTRRPTRWPSPTSSSGSFSTFELTLYTPYMEKVSPAVRNGDLFPYWPQSGTRIEIYGSEGLMLVGPHGAGWQVFGRPRREQPAIVERAYGRPTDAGHQEDFICSLRTRALPAADVEEAHRSTLLVHWADMSFRSGGRKLRIDRATDAVDDAEAMKFFRREYRKPWEIPA